MNEIDLSESVNCDCPEDIDEFGSGWQPDLPDVRDWQFLASPTVLAALPAKIDLRNTYKPPIFNQGRLNSCNANATATVHQFLQVKQGVSSSSYTPSRLFMWYYAREIEGTVRSNPRGSQLVNCFKAINNKGVCKESDWSYDDNPDTNNGKFVKKPTVNGLPQTVKYERIDPDPDLGPFLPRLKACLAEGYPLLVGFTIYDSFKSKNQGGRVGNDGIVPIPAANETTTARGHAVTVLGYDDNVRRFIIQNSFHSSWGDKGYGYIPYEYLTNANFTFWKLTLVRP